MTASPARVLLFGATGTIGRATARALLRDGYETVAFVRRASAAGARARLPDGIELRAGDVQDAASLAHDAFRGERFDAVVSCLASRTGAARDAWAIDDAAHRLVLGAAHAHGVGHFVLLSAICVQKPRLAFQHAKLAFERALAASGMRHSIVRPTAFFKSLSGQVERVRAGKPFLVFGDGRRTACMPIGDDDLARYVVECLRDETRWNRVLPIGGPGPAITPREQGEMLFALTGRPPRFRSVSPAVPSAIAAALGVLGRAIPSMADKSELARIGHYYATESMLVWDERAQRYDAAATPQYGTQTLREHYAAMLRGEIADDRGEHAVF